MLRQDTFRCWRAVKWYADHDVNAVVGLWIRAHWSDGRLVHVSVLCVLLILGELGIAEAPVIFWYCVRVLAAYLCVAQDLAMSGRRLILVVNDASKARERSPTR